jgi:pimeloyl-ACP methyl ester carboxylesterase
VDIGGRTLHLLQAGSGSPVVVVVVAAMADNVLMWTRIQRELAGEMRVCLYDRAGIGWSDPPPQGPRTFGDMAGELHDLLSIAGIPAPYVLVGHSVGGIVARQFAVRYPGAVSGIALIDSSHEDQVRRRGVDGWPYGQRELLIRAAKRQARILGMRRLAAALGLARKLDADIAREVPAEFAAAARAIALSSRQRRIQVRETLMLARSSGQPPALGSLPLAVVTAGRQVPGWVRMQEELASLSTRTTHLTAENAGHYVHLDDPELIVRVIRDLVHRTSRAQEEAEKPLAPPNQGARELCSGTAGNQAGGCGPFARQVAQNGYVADSLDTGQRHPVARAVREGGGVDEPRCARVTDKEWGDCQLYLVREPGRQELCVDGAAAFDH